MRESYPNIEKMAKKIRVTIKKNKKKMNLPIFLFPTQLLIQVQ